MAPGTAGSATYFNTVSTQYMNKRSFRKVVAPLVEVLWLFWFGDRRFAALSDCLVECRPRERSDLDACARRSWISRRTTAPAIRREAYLRRLRLFRQKWGSERRQDAGRSRGYHRPGQDPAAAGISAGGIVRQSRLGFQPNRGGQTARE